MPPPTLLRDVSRSFYLSIRLLPPPLRAPVGLAYLLARATDTVADTAAIAVEERRELLARVASAIAGEASVPAPLLARFIGAQQDPAEQRLMQRLGECVGELERLDPADRTDVRTVLAHIVRGQTLDLERPVVPDAQALRDYTYLVAGCVGEFWTDVCARHVAGYAVRSHDEMRALGRSFGCALQLVNIVRDAGDDRRAGRCYLPADEIASTGFDATWAHWQGEAAPGLADGMSYALAVNPRRIRAAVALPALIGRGTLARLRAAGPRALDERVKVPRSEVRALLLRIALGLAGRAVLQREWDNKKR